MYLQDLKIKNVAGLTNWFKSELQKAGKTNDVECVKNSSQVLVFWAAGNKLHKFEILGAPFIYVIKIEQIQTALIEILKTI